VAFDQIGGPDQHDAAGTRGLHYQLVAYLETGPTERVNRQRGLVFAADPRTSTAATLYFVHDK
jgi:hypothetical protein